jgi:hypothetical protein
LTAYAHDGAFDVAAVPPPVFAAAAAPVDAVVPSERRRAGVALALFGPLSIPSPVAPTVSVKPQEDVHEPTDVKKRRVRPSAEKRRRLKARAALAQEESA